MRRARGGSGGRTDRSLPTNSRQKEAALQNRQRQRPLRPSTAQKRLAKAPQIWQRTGSRRSSGGAVRGSANGSNTAPSGRLPLLAADFRLGNLER